MLQGNTKTNVEKALDGLLSHRSQRIRIIVRSLRSITLKISYKEYSGLESHS